MNHTISKLPKAAYKRICFFLINRVFISRRRFSNKVKCALLRSLGHQIGTGTTIISPIYIAGTVHIGNDCWINREFTVEGNGLVVIGDRCDIAPQVSFLTGGHKIGTPQRRAGEGETYTIRVGSGSWVGSRATILGTTTIGESSVVAACACVREDVPSDTLVGGVPARVIRKLEGEDVSDPA